MNAQFKSATYLVSSLAFALTLSGSAFAQGAGMTTAPAVAAAGQVTVKTLGENEKLRVIDAVDRPGDELPIAKHPMRAIYVISGGTLERTYADGTKEVRKLKTGTSEIITEMRPYAVKNIGKTTIHLFEVAIK